MKTRKNIALLYGGKSPEHDISCLSAAHIAEKISQEPYGLLLIGITRSGQWYLQPEYTQPSEGGLHIVEDASRLVSIHPAAGLVVGDSPLEVNCVFSLLHGWYGEDGTVSGALEVAGVPYVGSDVGGSALSMDKLRSKSLWRDAGLPVLPFRAIYPHQIDGSITRDTTQDYILRDIGLPLFVKPSRSGSSLGISRVTTAADILPALEMALQEDSLAVVEKAITARELEVSVIGDDEPIAFPPGEIIIHEGFYDYEAKYLSSSRSRIEIEADIPHELQQHSMKLARKAYTVLGLRGYGRIDFLMEKSTEKLFLSEANSIPGFTAYSLFMDMVVHAGISLSDFLSRIILLGEKHFQEKHSHQRNT